MSVTPQSALECPAVYASIGLLADTVATIPLVLYVRVSEHERARATQLPLYDLTHSRPNHWQTSTEWRQEAMVHLLSWGNAYARIRYGTRGAVALEPIHPSQIWPRRRADGQIVYDWADPAGRPVTLFADEVLHLRRRPFTQDGLSGQPVTSLHRDLIGSAIALNTYLGRFFANSAVPTGGIEIPAPLNDKAAEILRSSWERRHRGADNAHRIAILDGGMKYVPIAMNHEDAQLVPLYRQLSGEIASKIYGIPPHMVGDTEKSTSWGSGIEQQSIGFVVYVIRPYLILIEQALNAALLTPEGRRRYYFEFNIEGLLRGDFKTRMEGYSLMVQWGLATANEIRRLENLPPLPGGDERLHPLNMVPASMIRDVLLGKAPQAEPDTRSFDEGAHDVRH